MSRPQCIAVLLRLAPTEHPMVAPQPALGRSAMTSSEVGTYEAGNHRWGMEMRLGNTQSVSSSRPPTE
jgi:hypothetical protein